MNEWLRLFPPSASNWGPVVDRIFLALTALATVLTLGIGAFILFYAVRYRAGSSAARPREPSTRLGIELTWTLIPLGIALALFAWAAHGYAAMQTPPADAYVVRVVGKQWMWKAEHPGGQLELDELHVPVGRPTRLVLQSQDVIHSFYVPAFRAKQDILPGRYTQLWFEATRPGRYHLFCAEYCGTGHSHMRGSVIALRPAEFEEWLSPEAPNAAPVPGMPGTTRAGLVTEGAALFQALGCNACHAPGAAVLAPRLDGLYGSEVRLANDATVVADEEYLRESILYPNAKITAGYPAPSLMPAYAGQIDADELWRLVELVKAIRHGWQDLEDG